MASRHRPHNQHNRQTSIAPGYSRHDASKYHADKRHTCAVGTRSILTEPVLNHPPSILIVERDTIAGEALLQSLAKQGYRAAHVRTGEEAIQTLEREQASPDMPQVGVVIADQDAVGPMGGLGLIRRLHDDWPGVVPIIVSGFRKVEAAVQAMRLGAADYLLKPIVEAELIDAAERAVQRHLLLVEHDTAQQEITTQSNNDEAADPAVLHLIPESADAWNPMSLSEAMKDPERRILVAALNANDWNRGETAKQLDINRTTLYKKIRQYRLDEPA